MKCKGDKGDDVKLLSPSMRRVWIEILIKRLNDYAERSPSMRRVWIEITPPDAPESPAAVTLHAEGVD